MSVFVKCLSGSDSVMKIPVMREIGVKLVVVMRRKEIRDHEVCEGSCMARSFLPGVNWVLFGLAQVNVNKRVR